MAGWLAIRLSDGYEAGNVRGGELTQVRAPHVLLVRHFVWMVDVVMGWMHAFGTDCCSSCDGSFAGRAARGRCLGKA